VPSFKKTAVVVFFYFRRTLFFSCSLADYELSRHSYDYDTDPQKRAETPSFYGYIPDESRARTVLLAVLTFNGATVLLARCLGAALLLLVGNSMLFGILGAEMGIYLTSKVVRDDFYYWLPVDGVSGFLLSLYARFMVKIITDFTGVVQFRGSGEMGGLYFTVNSVMSFVFCFVAIKIFFDSDASKAGRLNEDGASTAFLWLFGYWALNAALGVSIIKKEYRRTFVSLETGCEWAEKFFLEGDTDKARSKTVRLNKKKWKAIRLDVKEWVQENWWRWKEETPDWFTDAWISQLPDDFIPADEDRVALRKLRRKSSAFGGDGWRLSLGGGGAATIAPKVGGESADAAMGSTSPLVGSGDVD
jgi:hypothetical protein